MDDEMKKIFSANLVRLLDMHEKTQADLYRYMKVSSATVSDWCNGKKLPRMDKIQSIANWLRVNVSDLLYEQDFSDILPGTDILIEKFNKMTEDQKEHLLTYAEFLLKEGGKL